MKANYPVQVVFYRTETGIEPTREWLKGLPRRDRKIIGERYKDSSVRMAVRYAIDKEVGYRIMGNQVKIR